MKYDIWFCGCGRIHFIPYSDLDWLNEDVDNRAIVQVCRNCGAIYETFLTEFHRDTQDNIVHYDLNGYDYCNDDDVTIDDDSNRPDRIWHLDKGIAVPMVEGGYADCYWNREYYISKHTSYECRSHELNDCMKYHTVDTMALIWTIEKHYPDIADDLLKSISGYVSGIDWSGTKYDNTQ